MKPRVNFIGLGAQKCASTWVHEVLAAHPQTFLSSPKELDYFSYFYGRGHDWYERFFAASTNQLAIGDNSPSYFPHPLAPARAAEYNPELRIVVALRDPIERAFSNHLHIVREGFLQGPDLSFERGMARNAMYVEQSRYATHLKRWLEYFPRDRLHVVLQEDIERRPAEMAMALYRFLGLREDFAPPKPGERANESSVSKRPMVDSALRGAAGLLRTTGMGDLVALAKRSPLVKRLRRSNQVGLRDIVPPMQAETRLRLIEEFSGEMKELSTLLGREDLPWRSFEEHRSASRMDVPSLSEHAA